MPSGTMYHVALYNRCFRGTHCLHLQGNENLISSQLIVRICLTTDGKAGLLQWHPHSPDTIDKQRSINNNSTVADKVHCGVPLQEALS
jgi:hypothetical protein